VARRFAAGGFHVALMSRSLERVEALAQQIVKEGNKATAVPVDVTNAQAVKTAFATVREQLGDPAVLVYNANTSFPWPPPKFMDITPERFEGSIAAQATGAFYAAQEVLPAMIAKQSGTILLTGATASLRGGASFATLAVGKFALRALGQSLAREFHPQGIHVAHILVDGQIKSERFAGSNRAPDSFLDPDALAEQYWQLHNQDKTVWTQELDVRPYVEKF
jgi:NAD(P)-dependent dehydrogenase (short-subunit alcohol dehydrogenase family)